MVESMVIDDYFILRDIQEELGQWVGHACPIMWRLVCGSLYGGCGTRTMLYDRCLMP